jgi:hypothetical protein
MFRSSTPRNQKGRRRVTGDVRRLTTLAFLLLSGCGSSVTTASVLGPTASPTITATPRASSPQSACQPTSQTGCLVVTPSSGPAGHVVTLEGTGCTYAGRSTYLVFEGEGFAETGTIGAVDIPDIATDSASHFGISFTIPAQLHSLQGTGGGPTRPGTYDFSSKPPLCFARFSVTSS